VGIMRTPPAPLENGARDPYGLLCERSNIASRNDKTGTLGGNLCKKGCYDCKIAIRKQH
jgi:hypothetical protein